MKSKYFTMQLFCNIKRINIWKSSFILNKLKFSFLTLKLQAIMQILQLFRIKKIKSIFRLCASNKLSQQINWNNFLRKIRVNNKSSPFSKDSTLRNCDIRKVSGKYQRRVRSKFRVFCWTLKTISTFNLNWQKY